MVLTFFNHIQLIVGTLLAQTTNSSTNLQVQRLIIFAEEQKGVQVEGEDQPRRSSRIRGYTVTRVAKTNPALPPPPTLVQVVLKNLNGTFVASIPLYPPVLYSQAPPPSASAAIPAPAPPISRYQPAPLTRRHLHHSQTLRLSSLQLLALKRKQRRAREARRWNRKIKRTRQHTQELRMEVENIRKRTIDTMREIRWLDMQLEMLEGEKARRRGAERDSGA